MSKLEGFWSYVHKDDDAEGGRIAELARDLVSEYELLTGEEIQLFLDQDSLDWGTKWRETIDMNLAAVAFFVPVLTPRYFYSPECRRELQAFARRATDLGIKDLILPLLYVDFPGLREEGTLDDLIKLARTFQWEDWTELRFEERSSRAYRLAISRLARRLIEANHAAEGSAISESDRQAARPIRRNLSEHREEHAGDEEAEDEPGWVDKVAEAEEALPEWNVTIQAIGNEIEELGEILQDGASMLDGVRSSKTIFRDRQRVAAQVARSLGVPTGKILELTSSYSSQLHSVDRGFRAILTEAPREVEANPESLEEVCEFFETVRSLADSANGSLAQSKLLIDSLEPLEKMSRDMRPVLRQLRKGLSTMLEAREVADEWVNLIETSGIDCASVQPSDPALLEGSDA